MASSPAPADCSSGTPPVVVRCGHSSPRTAAGGAAVLPSGGGEARSDTRAGANLRPVNTATATIARIISPAVRPVAGADRWCARCSACRPGGWGRRIAGDGSATSRGLRITRGFAGGSGVKRIAGSSADRRGLLLGTPTDRARGPAARPGALDCCRGVPKGSPGTDTVGRTTVGGQEGSTTMRAAGRSQPRSTATGEACRDGGPAGR